MNYTDQEKETLAAIDHRLTHVYEIMDKLDGVVRDLTSIARDIDRRAKEREANGK